MMAAPRVEAEPLLPAAPVALSSEDVAAFKTAVRWLRCLYACCLRVRTFSAEDLAAANAAVAGQQARMQAAHVAVTNAALPAQEYMAAREEYYRLCAATDRLVDAREIVERTLALQRALKLAPGSGRAP